MTFLRSAVVAAALFPLLAPALCAADEFTFKDSAGEHLDVLRDGKILARYMYAHDVSTPEKRTENYKPYLHVFDPAGTGPITKGAGGEFTHHRGIFIGWMKIGVHGETFDRWHMKGGDQVHEKFLTQTPGKDHASFTSLVKWQGKTPDQIILEEERTESFNTPPSPAYASIDTDSKTKAVAGDTTLDGDPEHSGLQFRPADKVDRSKTVYLYPIPNAQPHKDLDYPWIGESYTLDGHRYSVVYLNHPENPKEAHISAYRDYGRFGVFFKTSLPAGQTKDFRARILVLEGEMPSAEWIQKAWNDYTGGNQPVPQTTAKDAEYNKSPDSKKVPAATPPPAPAAR